MKDANLVSKLLIYTFPHIFPEILAFSFAKGYHFINKLPLYNSPFCVHTQYDADKMLGLFMEDQIFYHILMNGRVRLRGYISSLKMFNTCKTKSPRIHTTRSYCDMI